MALCPKCSWPLTGAEGEMPICVKPGCGYEPAVVVLRARFDDHLATLLALQREDLEKYEISNPVPNRVELSDASAGRILMHCDEDRIWYLHVGDQEIPLDELIGNLALIKRVMNELADNATLAQ